MAPPRPGVSLSFVVPMYNAAAHLERCVASLLGQGFGDGESEIILVNDGSTDGTEALARKLAAGSAAIRIVAQSNQGLSMARNAGLAVATGEYVWFVDSDDFILPGSARCLLARAKEHAVDVLTFEVSHVGPDGLSTLSFDPAKACQTVLGGHDYVAAYNYNNGAWLYLVRRVHLADTGLTFMPGRYCEDGMFTIALLSGAGRVAHYPSPAYAYVRNPQGITKTKSPAHYAKLAGDFLFAIAFIDDFLRAQTLTRPLSANYRARVLSRRDSYALFLCIRLLRSSLGTQEIKAYYVMLCTRGWVPLRELSRAEYPGLRYALLLLIINSRSLFLLTSCLTRCVRILRS